MKKAIFVTKIVVVFSLCVSLGLGFTFPVTGYANCEGIPGPAYFSLYKNKGATFSSVMHADTMQKYEIEWFVGSKSLGSVVKKAGESFTLKKLEFSSQTFSITGFYQKGSEWIVSHSKIFPDPEGGMQVRFDDGACDNSFVNSPDLKVTIKID